MGVGVDHSRKHRHLAEIDHASGGRLRLDLGDRPHGLDAFPFYQNAHVVLDLLRTAVDQTAGFDQDLLGR